MIMYTKNIFTLSNNLFSKNSKELYYRYNSKININFNSSIIMVQSLNRKQYNVAELLIYLNEYEENLIFSKPVFFKTRVNKKFLKINMFLIKSTVIKRGLRFRTLLYTPKPINSKFLFFKKSLLIKNNFYQHIFSHKKCLTPLFYYQNNFFKNFFYCVSFQKTHKKIYGVYKNCLGIYKVLPLIDCVRIGDKINFYKNIIKFMYFMYVGSVMQLKYYGMFFLISNLGLTKPKYGVSFGTYLIILKKKNNYNLIKLPSFQTMWFSSKYFAILGRNSGIHKNKEYFGKASLNHQLNKIIVRSVAKNPIDHPNGGRTRGKMLFKTPWGLVAKSSK